MSPTLPPIKRSASFSDGADETAYKFLKIRILVEASESGEGRHPSSQPKPIAGVGRSCAASTPTSGPRARRPAADPEDEETIQTFLRSTGIKQGTANGHAWALRQLSAWLRTQPKGPSLIELALRTGDARNDPDIIAYKKAPSTTRRAAAGVAAAVNALRAGTTTRAMHVSTGPHGAVIQTHLTPTSVNIGAACAHVSPLLTLPAWTRIGPERPAPLQLAFRDGTTAHTTLVPTDPDDVEIIQAYLMCTDVNKGTAQYYVRLLGKLSAWCRSAPGRPTLTELAFRTGDARDDPDVIAYMEDPSTTPSAAAQTVYAVNSLGGTIRRLFDQFIKAA